MATIMGCYLLSQEVPGSIPGEGESRCIRVWGDVVDVVNELCCDGLLSGTLPASNVVAVCSISHASQHLIRFFKIINVL